MGATTAFAQAVAAEVRAELAAQRISGSELAKRVGLSQNYIATRLRDEKPFTLDDIEMIRSALGAAVECHEFIARAWARRSGRDGVEGSPARRGDAAGETEP